MLYQVYLGGILVHIWVSFSSGSVIVHHKITFLSPTGGERGPELEVWFWPLLKYSTGYDRNTLGMSKLSTGRGSVTEGVLAIWKRGWMSALTVQHSLLSTGVFSSEQIILLSFSTVSDLTLNPVKVRSHRRCPWESGTGRVLADLWLLWLQDSRVLHAIWRPGWMPWGISRYHLLPVLGNVICAFSNKFPLPLKDCFQV